MKVLREILKWAGIVAVVYVLTQPWTGWGNGWISLVCVAFVVLLPPSCDPAIRLKEWASRKRGIK